MDVMHTDRRTCLGREDPLADSLLRRVGPMLLEGAYGEFGESDGMATACGFWSVDVAIEDGPLTCKVPPSKSTSRHWRPSNSPLRIPVVTASV